MFESMGFSYLGPVDGHDVKRLEMMLAWARELNRPVLLHVRTIKGERRLLRGGDAERYHGVAPFDPVTGEPKKPPCGSFSAVFSGDDSRSSRHATARMRRHGGHGGRHGPFALCRAFFPERFFDVRHRRGTRGHHVRGHGQAGGCCRSSRSIRPSCSGRTTCCCTTWRPEAPRGPRRGPAPALWGGTAKRTTACSTCRS
jgi:hypothetical protein